MIDQLKQQKAALWEQSEAKFGVWLALTGAARFYNVFGSNRDDAMYVKLQADADAIWTEYDALIKQWDAVELQLIELERAAMNNVTDSEVPAGVGQSVTADTCKHCGRNYMDCPCDHCELEGHNWIELSHHRACLTCGAETDLLCHPDGYLVTTSELSWREEIVEEALQEDESR